MIDGGTGTLGVGATICALAMGATKIFVTGRNTDLLARLKSVAPNRIHALVAGEGVVEEILQNTHGLGVDVIIQCLGANAPAKSVVTSIKALRRGGDLMTHQKSILGSLWFTTAEGQAMADMAEAGVLNLQVFEHQSYSIEKVDEALAALEVRDGGFTNIVIVH
ncbi:Zinc-binding dehydrogenase [compost metagenome]